MNSLHFLLSSILHWVLSGIVPLYFGYSCVIPHRSYNLHIIDLGVVFSDVHTVSAD